MSLITLKEINKITTTSANESYKEYFKYNNIKKYQNNSDPSKNLRPLKYTA